MNGCKREERGVVSRDFKVLKCCWCSCKREEHFESSYIEKGGMLVPYKVSGCPFVE